MAVEICAIGGYGEVGKNMTAIKVDEDVVIIDMGLHLPNYIHYTEEANDDFVKANARELRKVKAIPNDDVIKDWKKRVRAILTTHAHLDHIGAMPYLASQYNCPIIGPPFACEVLKRILKDERIKLPNKIRPLQANSKIKISEKITVEFIHMTHSIPHAVMIAVHTPYGAVLYCNDFKFDKNPILGKPPNFKALEKLGKSGVLVAIIDSLYSDHDMKTPSEAVAREMLRDVLLGVDSRNKAVIVTTFASHIARLKSIVEMGKKLNRKIIFMGRSLAKYIDAAESCNLVNFSKEAEICKFAKQTKSRLRTLEREGVHKYLLIVTGHQGEPKATLSKMANNEIPFKFFADDHVIFSCKIIPSEINVNHRKTLENKLKSLGVRIFKDIHVSGHAAREDIRDLLKLTKPKFIIPSHSPDDREEAFLDLGKEMGYDESHRIKMNNGDRMTFE